MGFLRGGGEKEKGFFDFSKKSFLFFNFIFFSKTGKNPVFQFFCKIQHNKLYYNLEVIFMENLNHLPMKILYNNPKIHVDVTTNKITEKEEKRERNENIRKDSFYC